MLLVFQRLFHYERFTAAVVAEKLLELFTRHGIPKEILTDQGTNFMSCLLKELYKMLGVKSIRTTPYHPQTNGLVERFNQTLKQMLRKMMSEEGRNWDRMLPFVLFAYREVPHTSTGYSPVELICGRDVRGPLEVLKEAWTGSTQEDSDILTYVTRVYQRIATAKELVEQNLKLAQKKQKKWYDKRARDLVLQEGEKVLLLLPNRSEKLLAKWRGPYKVLRKIGRVNYEVEIPKGRKKSKTFHINMLKPWKESAEECYLNVVSDEDEELLCVSREKQDVDDATYGIQLSPKQMSEMKELIQKYHDIVGNELKKTRVAEHKIPTSSRPIRWRPYRLPPAIKDDIIELNELKDSGIIEESNSDWASPIVVVQKKDGICMEYQKLNSTKFDAYPRIDEMLDAVGKSKYLTTLDLL